MRPVGIILAILAGSLIVSYSGLYLFYASQSQNLPYEIIVLAVGLGILAVIAGGIEEYAAGDDVDRLVEAVQVAVGPGAHRGICAYCGTPIKWDVHFCPNCGRPIPPPSAPR
jgi:hypothetical protein